MVKGCLLLGLGAVRNAVPSHCRSHAHVMDQLSTQGYLLQSMATFDKSAFLFGRQRYVI